MVEVAVAGPPEQHRAVEPERGDRPFQLARGLVRGGCGERREALEVVRMLTHHVGEQVVGLCLQSDGLIQRQVLHTGRG